MAAPLLRRPEQKMPEHKCRVCKDTGIVELDKAQEAFRGRKEVSAFEYVSQCVLPCFACERGHDLKPLIEIERGLFGGLHGE